MLYTVSDDADGITTSGCHFEAGHEAVNHIIHKAETNRFTVTELMELKGVIDNFFNPSFVVKPNTQESVAQVQRRYVVPREGYPYCILCSKWSNETHLSSTEHVKRAEETAAADEMIGPCVSIRRFSSTPGMVGPLSKSAFRRFWGADVDTNMPQLLMDRLKKGCTIEVMMRSISKKAKRVLRMEDVRSVGFSAVSYPGQGRYATAGQQPERAIRWEDLTEDAETHLQHSIPPNSGWWPALIVTWHTEHLDHGYDTREEYFPQVCVGILTVYVICWYQLVDGSVCLTAWPILLTFTVDPDA